jgi:cyanate permease
MAQQRLPQWLGFVAVPLAVLPALLAVRPPEDRWFFVVIVAACFAAPIGGFWWGERKGSSEATRAAFGCVGTLALFALHLLWAFVLARLLFDR